MSCKVKQHALDVLEEKGAIKDNVVVDFRTFDQLNEEFTRTAKEKYNVGTGNTPLFSVSMDTPELTVIPNDMLLNALDAVIQQQEEAAENAPKDDTIFESKIEKLTDDKQSPFLSYVPVDGEYVTEDEQEVDYSPTNEHILFDSGTPKTAAEVIQNILVNFPDINENTAFLLKKVIPILGATNATIRFVSKKSLKGSDTLMQYNADNNEIQISKDTLKEASPEYAVQSFLHEVVHSVTAQAYLKPSTLEQQMFRDFINDQFAKYSELSDSYGLTNPMEFIAEIISNRAFQQEITTLDKSNKGFWQKLIDFIRMLFGVKKTTDFHNIVESITTIANNSDTQFTGINGRNNIFEFKKEEPTIPSLKTIEEKTKKLVQDAIDNIEQAAKRVKVKGKKGVARENAYEFKEQLQELKDQMERYAEAEQYKAIVLYVKSLRGTVLNLKSKVEEADRNSDKIVDTMVHYENYLTAYDMLDDINALVDEALESDTLTESQLKDIEEIDNILATFAKDHKRLLGRISTIKKKAITKVMAKKEYFPEVEHKWKTKLEAEYDPLTAKGASKAEWVTQQMIGPRAEEIQQDVEAAALSAAEDIDEDITWAEAKLSDPLNANGSRLFRLAVGIVAQMRNRIIQAVHDFEFELDGIFQRMQKGSKTMVPSKRYQHMIETDSDGNHYLVSEYSIEFKEAYEEYLGLKQELKQLRYEAQAMGWEEHEIRAAEDYREIIEQMRAWEAKHTIREKGTKIPHPKYKTDLSKLSEADLEFLNLFREINRVNEKTFGKHASLRTRAMNVEYHRLPSISKSNHERLIEKDGKGIIKDNWNDATKVRTDDVGYEEQALDGKNRPLKDVRVHYRGKIDPNEQSLDLPTLLRMEYHNGVNYKEKSQTKIVLDEIAEMAGNKKYIATSQRTGQWLVNLFRKNKDVATVDGKDSVTYNRLKTYIDTNIHDILNVHAGFSLAGADVNKLVKTVNGYTATLGMALNIASGSVNLLNGFSQLYIETFGGNHISFKSLQKAEGMYFRDLPNVLADLGRPVKKSVTNQINQMFDTFGGFSIAQQEFFKNTVAKRLASLEVLSGMQDGGEHMMQSILTMAVLDGIKVMDDKGQFFDKKGNKTDEKGAASLLDMIKLDENQQAYVSGKVYYTTHTRNIDFHDGGQAHVSLFIKKKIEDTAGVYDSNFQPEVYRHWYGKLLLLFKRFLISQMQNRWTGISTAHKKKSQLTDRDRSFNIGIKEYVEGTHVTALRLFVGNPMETWRTFMQDGVVTALKSLKLAHLPENYKALNDYEKANLRKATADIIATAVLLPLLGMLAEAAAGDDDDEYLWYLAYLTRRLESELSQFRNPREAWRITSNPIAGTRVIENALTVIGGVLSPWDYLDEDSKGNNKLIKNAEKLVPVWVQFKKEWKQSYHFIENQAN